MSQCNNYIVKFTKECAGSTFFYTLLFLSSFASLSTPTWATEECGELLTEQKKPLSRIDPETFAFAGLTQEGEQAFRDARDAVRRRDAHFGDRFRQLQTVHHVAQVARLTKQNVFLYGPPGGAKSAFVAHFMRGEEESPFKLQLHQMITEQAITGGQDFKAAQEGLFRINTKGSAADWITALIDELDKGNPAAIASLLSLLNEREVLAGGQVIKARLQTLFATSNANLPEIFQQFMENGQGSTAPALLNRFQFKGFVYNWLPLEDQAALDRRRQRRSYLETLADTHPEVRRDEVFLEPEKLDWWAMRKLARAIFKPNELFMTTFLQFANDMRVQTNRAIRESEERHLHDPLNEPFVYFPSADNSERLREQIPEIVIMSAFIDFLRSPLADDPATFAQLRKKPIELDPLSLWRASLVMTTIGLGQTRLVSDLDSKQEIDIHFGWSIDESLARDKREVLLIQNLKNEQQRFKQAYLRSLSGLKEQIKMRARHAAPGSSELEKHSFESLLLRVSGD